MRSSPEALNYRPQTWLKPAGAALAGLAVVVVAVGLFVRASAGQGLKNQVIADAVPTVDIVLPQAASKVDGLTLPGVVQANYDAIIHARVSGYLKKWYVDIGARVKAGQSLADIDTPELDQQLEQAKADLATAVANQDLAKTTAERWTALLSRDAVSRQEADEKNGDYAAKTALVQAAKANLDRLNALESFKRIVAPFDGVVTARTTDVGALIAAGDPSAPGLFTVADVHRLRVYVQVPQVYSAQIKPGEIAALTVPEYPGRTFQATVATSSDAIGARSGATLVELQMDNTDGALKPGEYTQARFTLPAAGAAVRIPASALLFRNDGLSVAVLGPNDHAELKRVEIQQDLGSSVDLSRGIALGDRVINNPPDSLVEGEPLRQAPAHAAAGQEG